MGIRIYPDFKVPSNIFKHLTWSEIDRYNLVLKMEGTGNQIYPVSYTTDMYYSGGRLNNDTDYTWHCVMYGTVNDEPVVLLEGDLAPGGRFDTSGGNTPQWSVISYEGPEGADIEYVEALKI